MQICNKPSARAGAKAFSDTMKRYLRCVQNYSLLNWGQLHNIVSGLKTIHSKYDDRAVFDAWFLYQLNQNIDLKNHEFLAIMSINKQVASLQLITDEPVTFLACLFFLSLIFKVSFYCHICTGRDQLRYQYTNKTAKSGR